MPRKRTAEPPAAEPELKISRDEAYQRISERIQLGHAIVARDFRVVDDVESARDEYRKWSDYNNELLKRIFTTPKLADEYSWWGVATASYDASPAEKLEDLRNDVRTKIRRLESVRERLELIPVAAGVNRTTAINNRIRTNKVFVVHGHDEAARETIARFLEKFGIEAVILHEQATGGRTIIEKLEHYSDVDFAVVLLTPDDVGGKGVPNPDLQPRARQNVVLELGYFAGKLGRTHVCALYRGPLELPSDIVGVGYVPLDSSGGWRLQLAKELKAAGFDVDMNLAL